MPAINGEPQIKNRRDKHHNRLFEVRIAKKMSQRKLGELSGLNRNTIMKIENGDSSPNLDSCRRICSALGVSFDEVF